MNAVCLCAGIGGIELGLSLADPSIVPICFVERDNFCQQVLSRRFPETPIWDDLATWPAATWRGADILTAGFPCQPWSYAGGRKGTTDERWLWPRIAECVRLVGPRYVFLENVPGLFVGGIGHVLGDLASLGYDAEWGVFSCSGLGAPQRRDRIFILGYFNYQVDSRDVSKREIVPRRPGEKLADPPGTRVGRVAMQSRTLNSEPGRTDYPIWPPGPTDDWQHVSPTFWPAESGVRGVAPGISSRVERSKRVARLRALGNSVSPPVAAAAWTILSGRMRL